MHMRLFAVGRQMSNRRYVADVRKFIKIGDVRVPIRTPSKPHLVPKGYVGRAVTVTEMSHLKWLLQKDLLKQDAFLIGAPGAQRTAIVLQYLELCDREYEYISITRDTTEADIKQRREIRNGTAFYTDLCAVRAALFGRVLVIDGVEKAERNVLPILNSLLESREMQLDDGRFLIPASKYDKLAKEYGENELRAKQLERVSEDFFVIALGLPVPPFKGYALDPPLRSRFQCRQIGPLSFSDLYEKCCSVAPNIPSDQISNLVSMCLAMNSSEARSTALPSFPIDSFLQLATIWNTMPSLEAERVFELAYPYSAFLKSDVHYPVLNEFLDKFSVTRKKSKCNAKLFSTDRNTNRAAIVWNDSERYINTIFGVNSGTFSPRITYVPNAEHDRLLSEMALCHGIGDFCLLGPRGSGKTTVVEEFAKRFNYEPTTIMMYQDMNSRELLQQRKMLDNGDTVWEDSVLVQCAKSGGLCVLDGIERAHWSSVEVLAPLIHHRQIDLFDGTRLVSCGQFKKLMEASGKTKRQLEESGIFEILPSFRIIAIGDSESGPQWLNDQIRSLFLFVTTDSLNAESQCTVIQKLVPGCDMLATKILVSLVERLRNSADPGLRGVSNSLTLRKIIYLCKRQVLHRGENLCAGVRRAALWKFLPVLTRNAFEEELANSGISSSSPHDDNLDDSFRPLTNSSLTGPSSLHCRENFDPTMVPDTLFYDNEQHLKVISDMARDMELGYHLLLIGNQGVGKNKITDRFLHLVNRPRHYLQLHRDTTVQSLTVHSTVVDGRVVLEDSPLVKAARDGHILVIDEADKAPLHVVAVLKSLLDNGVLRLADGRLIEPASQSKGPLSIPLHPDFRIIMLANRPGFPFLGNDLFSLLGDLFSVNIVDNPSRSSELLMLKKYAPSVDDVILDQLCSAFDDLRKLADNLSLPYPYSIRELVNIAKHIERFPNDGVIKAIRNVFDFDQYSDETLEVVEKVFQRHGIPFGVSQRKRKVMLTRAHPIPPLKVVGEWGVRNDVVPLRLHVNTLPIRTNYRSNVSLKEVEMLEQHMRSSIFSEQEFFYQLPFDHRNICSDISSQGSRFAVTTVAPPTLFIGDRNRPDVVQEVDISLLLPPIRAGYKPRIRTCFLPSGQLLVHEEVSNVLLCFDAHSQSLTRLSLNEPSMMHSMFERFTPLSVNAAKRFWRMSSIFPHILFEKNGNGINMIGLNLENYVELELPENFMLNNVTSCGDTNFITMSNCGIHLVTLEDRYAVLREVYSAGDIPSDLLCGRKVKLGGGDKAVFADNKDYYVLTSNAFPPTFSVGELAASPREKTEGYVYSKRPFYVADDLDPLLNSGALVRITSEGTLVRALPLWATPRKAMEGIDKSAVSNVAGFLEVVFPVSEQVQYIPVAKSQSTAYNANYASQLTPAGFHICLSDDDSIFTCDVSGGVRKWQVGESSVLSALRNWRNLFGQNEDSLRIEFEKDDFDFSKLDSPKIGKFDPSNTPHVGGSTWAGGTGGYNTAGLGGVGGPFRLDAGHDVHQLSQEAKDAVPEHIKRKAREIARKEYQKRLKEIEMSSFEADAYNQIYNRIEKQTKMLRTVIDSLEAKAKEREWVRHQTTGDLDDAKLVEGITGEKSIYRRRMDKEPESGALLKKPKRLRICFDVSGSMYRFNGYDNRLQRSLESALLVMEALKGNENKIKYDIQGHSGDAPDICFVKVESPPRNEKERFDVLKKMLAHTQFCMSGDHTLEAIDSSVQQLAKEDADERFLIVLSDANLNRYGISPEEVLKFMNADEKVRVFLILIGSLGEQAKRMKAALPPGRSFVCTDTTQMPQIMQNIFSSAVID